ncbi:Rieske (2Fe-2S) protein [Zhihengliuella salsuginis]|uniref:Cytochrome bc1 complex Rieske iron-sulfur subunit n=1 Tax=Zhihengliuella salsuginis TaxID=578222 RepID=A0ABQ3GC49_9MICC|nr:Rieske (2Fe-2S) protein [Zhihengliuella salsuginis]GHD01282.1 hypothetical protein GCM10008096_05210 [Zhihengliuella salsuginis]
MTDSTPAGIRPALSTTSRRRVLAAAPVAGAAAALAACSAPAEPQAVPTAGTEAEPHVVAAVSDLPRGSKLSVEIDGRNYLLFRPSETDVLAYRALCTHQGCQVMVGEAEAFQCPCHNSEFSPEDGAAIAGPADDPLERFAAEIDGDDVVVFV